MRVAQFVIGESGEEASVVVYHFSGAGGSVEQNFERWIGQFEGPDGGEPRVESTNVVDRSGLTIHELAVEGTFIAEVTPGADER